MVRPVCFVICVGQEFEILLWFAYVNSFVRLPSSPADWPVTLAVQQSFSTIELMCFHRLYAFCYDRCSCRLQREAAELQRKQTRALSIVLGKKTFVFRSSARGELEAKFWSEQFCLALDVRRFSINEN